MKKIAVILLSVVALAASAFAVAQPSGSFQALTPITRDLGALTTLTAGTAATTNSADQNGYNVSRVICVFRQSTYQNSPSTTFKIQNKDAASGQYYDLVTSAAVTTSTSASAIAAGAGVATASNVSIGLPIAKTWRTSVTVGGTTPVVTGTIGCSVQ